jgi:hypothetical protein
MNQVQFNDKAQISRILICSWQLQFGLELRFACLPVGREFEL